MTVRKIFWFVIPASIILIVGLVVGIRYGREIRTARQTLNSLGSQVIDTDCGPIEYAQVGQGSPILAIHGTMGGFDQGLVIAKPAIVAGYQVISVSRFGYLRTPLPADASVDKQADAYACLLDSLGIKKLAIITTSGGATSTIRFATRYPEKVSALILVSPAAPGPVKVSPPPKAVFETLRSDFVWWAMITYLQTTTQTIIGVPKGFPLTPELEVEVKNDLVQSLPISDRINGSIFDNYSVDSEFYDEISATSPYSVNKIQVPVLVINALDDPYANPENVRVMTETFPNAQLVVFPNGGHELLGHADEVNMEITGFLSSLVTAAKINH
jgi:pimeloyl-ACP methyl ester carboxylesterase